MAKVDTLNRDLKAHVRAGKPGRWSLGDGLCFQLSATGSATWALRYTANGARKVMTLAPAVLPVSERELMRLQLQAAEHRDGIKAGLDPLAQRVAEQQAERDAAASETFEDVARAYVEIHRPGWRSPTHAQQWQNTLEQHVYPIIGDIKSHEITTQDVLDVLTQRHKSGRALIDAIPETASRVRMRIETILEDLFERRLDQPAERDKWKGWTNPARLTNALKKRLAAARMARGGNNGVHHHAALAHTDAPAFIARLRQETDLSALALLLTILCATRTSETLLSTWREIDLEAGIWTIPAERMKARKEHRIPLSTAAVELLQNLPRFRNSEYLFPGRTSGRPLSQMAMLARMRGLAPGLTTHGFRSTFRDWIADTTLHPDTIAEQALAHTVKNKVEAAYRRGEALARRKVLMQHWAEYLNCAGREGEYAEKWREYLVKPFV